MCYNYICSYEKCTKATYGQLDARVVEKQTLTQSWYMCELALIPIDVCAQTNMINKMAQLVYSHHSNTFTNTQQ